MSPKRSSSNIESDWLFEPAWLSDAKSRGADFRRACAATRPVASWALLASQLPVLGQLHWAGCAIAVPPLRRFAESDCILGTILARLPDGFNLHANTALGWARVR